MDPGVYLLPPEQDAEGCNGVPQVHTLSVYNNTGAAGTFAMSYSVPSANGTLTGPATVTAANGAVVPFDVTLTPDLCAQMGALVEGQVDTAGNGYTDSAVIEKTVTTGGDWDTVPNSAPTWAGNGYLSDGCTARERSGQAVTYLIGDMSGTGPVGFWGYNHATNAWFQPGPTGTPADRWAPDWAYNPATNLCYLTGGANTPGGGTYNEAYVFDPVANTFTALRQLYQHPRLSRLVDRRRGRRQLPVHRRRQQRRERDGQSTQCFDLAGGTWAAGTPPSAPTRPTPGARPTACCTPRAATSSGTSAARSDGQPHRRRGLLLGRRRQRLARRPATPAWPATGWKATFSTAPSTR